MTMKKLIQEWVLPLTAAVILALLVNRFIFFNSSIPSESMYPTIKIGDHIFTTRIYNPEKIKRGDIIVFYSKELKQRLIKRVIGLPGDTVEVKNDYTVWVNGNKLDEPYVKNNGGKTGTYKVPEKQYFFMGDNRSNSLDSRYWENSFISSKDILGKAQFIEFPFSRFGKF